MKPKDIHEAITLLRSVIKRPHLAEDNTWIVRAETVCKKWIEHRCEHRYYGTSRRCETYRDTYHIKKGPNERHICRNHIVQYREAGWKEVDK